MDVYVIMFRDIYETRVRKLFISTCLVGDITLYGKKQEKCITEYITDYKISTRPALVHALSQRCMTSEIVMPCRYKTSGIVMP